MGLLDRSDWDARIFVDGWTSGEGGDYPVIEPATGDTMGRMGLATPADVDAAVRRAREVQPAWAARPYEERAAVLRRAGDLWGAHSDELAGWIVRESGGVPAKAEFELHIAAGECYEAAALASAP